MKDISRDEFVFGALSLPRRSVDETGVGGREGRGMMRRVDVLQGEDDLMWHLIACPWSSGFLRYREA